MSMPSVRLADISTSDPCGASPRPNTMGSGNVFINGMPSHMLSNPWAPHACPLSPPHDAVTASGSGSVFVNGMPMALLGSNISCGSKIAMGSGNVFGG